MVVALLGMLFVVGVAFLQTVTFDARQIDAEVQARQEAAGIDAIEAKVFQALTDQWLAADGVPYQMAGPGAVECIETDPATGGCVDLNGNTVIDRDEVKPALPAYGELPYVHGLTTPIEPHLAIGAFAMPVLPYAGDVEAALKGEPSRIRDFFNPGVPIDLNNLPGFAVDADGDGIPDSREFDLTTNGSPIVLPPDAREALRERLNDPDATTKGVFLSVKAVPHGGMVDVNWSHHELVYAVFPEAAGTPTSAGPLRDAWQNDGSERPYHPYRPEIEEAGLRHRGGLPPRRLCESTLQRNSDFFEFGLLGLHRMDPTSADNPGTYEAHRWWFHDVAELGISPNTPFWYDIMAVPEALGASFGGYDRRHLLTTYSTDSLIMRDGTFDDPGRYGRGWIELTKNGWDLDDYPAMLGYDDPRKAHMQISLPYLEVSLLDDPQDDPVQNGVNSLPIRLTSTDPQISGNAQKFIRTIQGGFLLMLRNVPGEKDSTPVLQTDEKERIAASLTANLIDFADSDDTPTQIAVVDTNGVLTGDFVYGLERQPFITEVYTKVVGLDPGPGPDLSQSFSVVELYNPYDVALDLSPFTLQVDENSGIKHDFQLSGSIPPTPVTGIPGANAGFKLLALRRSNATVPPGAEILSESGPLLQDQWTVRITRQHTSVPPETVAVEEFDISGTSFFSGSVDPGDTVEESVERAMWRVRASTPLAFWTAVVPLTKAQANTHSLGDANSWKGQDSDPAVNQLIRPVHVDFANQGSLWQSFPTTGTLLLLMRHANSEVGSGFGPFNSHLISFEAAPNEREQYQIDNGRMPVFDVAGKHRLPQSTSSHVVDNLPMGYQFLPWGQYVFDYFTALPLDNEFAANPNLNLRPEVDSAGARVYGRININAAPWTVLQGLPLVRWSSLPASYQDVLQQFTYLGEPNGSLELPIGEQVAKAIAAYRDARQIPGAPTNPLERTGDFLHRAPDNSANPWTFPRQGETDVYGIPAARAAGELRLGSGFLTVGELANVRHPGVAVSYENNVNVAGDEYTLWRIDGGVVGRRYADPFGLNFFPPPPGLTNYPSEDYVQAVGLLVALGDWVTTRSNVWTIYGTLRGDRTALRDQLISEQGLSPEEATRVANERIDERAIRFEETVDRLPSFLDPGSPPRRIGERHVGPYNNTRAD